MGTYDSGYKFYPCPLQCRQKPKARYGLPIHNAIEAIRYILMFETTKRIGSNAHIVQKVHEQQSQQIAELKIGLNRYLC